MKSCAHTPYMTMIFCVRMDLRSAGFYIYYTHVALKVWGALGAHARTQKTHLSHDTTWIGHTRPRPAHAVTPRTRSASETEKNR